MNEPQAASMGEEPLTLLEKNQRLSQSLLWKLQQRFYEQQGIASWQQGIVPQYITSNPYIAHSYAKIVNGFLQDWSDQGLDRSQPLYIVELATGSGRFAYHFLRSLEELRFPVLDSIQIVYVMTDLVEQMVEFWQQHPSLQPFVEQGVLDFAQFDATQDQTLQLSHSGVVLTPGSLANPGIVLANYFLDSIPQDAFQVRRGTLHETLMTLHSRNSNVALADSDLFSSLEIFYELQPTETAYYENPLFNQILQNYCKTLSDQAFSFPNIGLQCLDRLQQLWSGRLLFITGDKGYSQPDFFPVSPEPEIRFHGSFSLTVNFHAIGQYTQLQQGQALLPSYPSAHLNIGAFLWGHPCGSYPATRRAYQEAVEQQGPNDFYALKTICDRQYDTCNLDQLLALLRFSGWDADIFMKCVNALLTQLATASPSQRQEIRRATDQIWRSYYHLGEPHGLPFYLGYLLYHLGDYAAAIPYFEAFLNLYGPDFKTFYNIAMCHYHLQQWPVALEAVEVALQLNPNFVEAHELRQRLENSPQKP